MISAEKQVNTRFKILENFDTYFKKPNLFIIFYQTEIHYLERDLRLRIAFKVEILKNVINA